MKQDERKGGESHVLQGNGSLQKDGNMATKLWDNGGRRQRIERRQYSYAGHIPERRTGHERRNGRDRRKGPRLGPEHRKKK